MPNSRQGAERLQQTAVEGVDILVTVTRFPRVQLEQQHVFAIEAELDRLQVRQRSHEESSRYQHQQRDPDLSHDERVSQAHARERMARARFARSYLLEGWYEVDARRPDRWRETK